jgi:hypothetical protein
MFDLPDQLHVLSQVCSYEMKSSSITQMLTRHGSDIFDLISIVKFLSSQCSYSSTVKYIHLHSSTCQIRSEATVFYRKNKLLKLQINIYNNASFH